MFFALHRPLLQRCAKKFALRHCGHRVGAKKFALQAQNGPKLAFCGVLGEFFRGNVAGGGVLGEFFAIQQPCDPVGRTLSRRSPGTGALLLAVLTL